MPQREVVLLEKSIRVAVETFCTGAQDLVEPVPNGRQEV